MLALDSLYVAVYDVTYMYTLIRNKLYMRMVELIDTHTPYNIPTGCPLSRVQLVFIKEGIMTELMHGRFMHVTLSGTACM